MPGERDTTHAGQPPRRTAAGRRRGRLALRIALAAGSLVALGWIVARLGPGRVVAVALRADPWWLAASLVPLAGRFLIWGVKWRGMLRRQAPVRYADAQRMVMAGSFANLVTPTGKLAGGVVRAVILHRRHGWRRTVAFGWTLADQITNIAGGAALYGLAALAAAPMVDSPTRAVLAGTGTGALLLAAALPLLRRRLWRHARRPALARALARWTPARLRPTGATMDEAWVRRLLRPLLEAGGRWRAPLVDAGMACLSFGLLCLAHAMVLRGLRVDSPLPVIAVAVALGQVAGTGLLGAWGGLGITEAAITGLLVQLGVPTDAAAAGVLLHRASFYGLILVWGGLAAWAESRRPGGSLPARPVSR